MDDPLAGNGTRQEGILDVSVAGDVSAQRFLLYVLSTSRNNICINIEHFQQQLTW